MFWILGPFCDATFKSVEALGDMVWLWKKVTRDGPVKGYAGPWLWPALCSLMWIAALPQTELLCSAFPAMMERNPFQAESQTNLSSFKLFLSVILVTEKWK